MHVHHTTSKKKIGVVIFLLTLSFLGTFNLPYVFAQNESSTNVQEIMETTSSNEGTDPLAETTPTPPNFDTKKTQFLKAQIVELKEEVQDIKEQDADYNNSLPLTQKRKIQHLKLEMLAGPDRGQLIDSINTIANQPKDLNLAKGDTVITSYTVDSANGKKEIFVIDHARAGWNWVFIIVFLLALVVFGGKKGFTSALGLVVTVSLLLFVFIPAIMAGWNPIFLAVVISTIVTIMIHIFVAGFTPKALASTIGTVGGTLVASLLGAGAMYLTHLIGLSSEEARVLFLDRPLLDFRGIFLASIVIGSLGAVMDVGISISSAIQEVHEHHPNPTFADLYRSGMNVGKDILGTMVDTLVLAYIGSALPSLLLMVSYNNWDMSLNYDFIAEELIRSIAGGFGLLAAIPLTAYFSAIFEIRTSKK